MGSVRSFVPTGLKPLFENDDGIRGLAFCSFRLGLQHYLHKACLLPIAATRKTLIAAESQRAHHLTGKVACQNVAPFWCWTVLIVFQQ